MKNKFKTILVTSSLVAFGLATSGHALAEGKMSADSQRLIIKFKDSNMGQAQRQAAMARLSATAGKNLSIRRQTALGSHVIMVKNTNKSELQALIARLSKANDILYVEEDRMMQRNFEPNDTHYPLQWHYSAQGTSINAPAAWDKADGGGVVVAVLDTGYRPHVDLVANILPGYDMIDDSFVANDGDLRDSDASDPGDWTLQGECGQGQPSQDYTSSWHGTHVSGTIAAVTNNNAGVAGIAYAAKVVPVRVLGKCGGYTSDIVDGIVWASGGSVSGVPANANPAQVINMSLGGSGACSQTYLDAINVARANGTTVVVSAGNSNADAANYTPASCAGVISVASTGPTGDRAYYSNYGTVVDVAGPGGDMSISTDSGVLSTLNDGAQGPGNDIYAWYQGTSMAAPHLAGIAALLYDAKPNATPDEVENAIKLSAQAFVGTCSQCGTGLADANAAIDEILNPTPIADPVGWTETALSSKTRKWKHFTITVAAGASTLDIDMSGGTGDADLYVKFGSQPTSSSYDYRPFLNGNNESVSVSSPSAGTWYISVYAYRSYSGVTLDAYHVSPL